MSKVFAVLVSIAMLFGMQGPELELKESQPLSHNTVNTMDLAPSWTTGSINGSNPGYYQTNIIVSDLNNDGITDITYCVGYYPVTINYQGSGDYGLVWYGEDTNCRNIKAGDRDKNGRSELYIVTTSGMVLVYDYDGVKYDRAGAIVFDSVYAAIDLAVGDVDNDSSLEIAVSRQKGSVGYYDLLIYDANTLVQEWAVERWGGKDIEIANVDGDPQPEIVVNKDDSDISNYKAHIVDAVTRTQEWLITGGGFGLQMALGDVDGDLKSEIAYVTKSTYILIVLDADTRTIKWQTQAKMWSTSFSIVQGDINGDGNTEVIMSPGETASMVVYNGMDGTLLDSYGMIEVTAIAVGDANNDGFAEIVSRGGEIVVYNWQMKAIEWVSDVSPNGPFLVVAGDLEKDGSTEIVTASCSSTSVSNPGILQVYDGSSHELKWSMTPYNGYKILALTLGQYDSDPAQEILVAYDYLYKAIIQVYDGATHSLEWQLGDLSVDPTNIRGIDLDRDAIDEIVVGISNNRILVLESPLESVWRDIGILTSPVFDWSVGDLDGDSIAEIAILAQEGVYIYKTDTWTQTSFKPLSYTTLLQGSHVAILPADSDNMGKLVTLTTINNNQEKYKWFQVWDGASLKLERTAGFDRQLHVDIIVADVDMNGLQEINLVGQNTERTYPSTAIYYSILLIGSPAYPEFWLYQGVGHWGDIGSLAVSDTDTDGESELLFGSSDVIQENEIIKTPHNYEKIFLPAVMGGGNTNSGIYGQVKENGTPVAGVSLDLRMYDGTAWVTSMSTTTNSQGIYSFAAPTIYPGQYYYVLYSNPEKNPNRLWTWHTRSIGPYETGDTVLIGDFDLATVNLLAPADYVNLKFPVTFSWVPRPATPSDSYELDMVGVYYPNATWWTDLLGYAGQYQLNGLPPGFVYSDLYAWEIWIYSPDGGYGVSYDAHLIIFNNNPFGPELLEKAPREKNLPEIFPRFGQ